MSLDQQILGVLQRLWDVQTSAPGNLYDDPDVVELMQLYNTKYSLPPKTLFGPAPVLNALRKMGCPRLVDMSLTAPPLVQLGAVKAELDNAYGCNTVKVRHLCPLDMLCNLPDFQFGNAQVVNLSQQQLDQLLKTDQLRNYFTDIKVDSERLSEFTWLIVEESVQVGSSPVRRAGMAFLDQSMDFDHGRIEPHRSTFPKVVEEALFFLLLASWEDWIYDRFDWRGFTIPWVYTVSDDLFSRPDLPPTADGLSWEPHYQQIDDSGEQVYVGDRPICTSLLIDADVVVNEIQSNWNTWVAAKGTSLFETPIVHFFVRAFTSSHIDEFISHLTSIEAAIGTQADYGKSKTLPDGSPRKGYGKGATKILELRIDSLLGHGKGAEFTELFNLRSQYIHGRGGLLPIPSARRNSVRSLARKVIYKLIQQASSSSQSRDIYLDNLLP